MSDLDIIFPNGIELELGGKQVTVKKFKFGQLPKVMKALKTIAEPAIAAIQQGQQPDLALFMEIGADVSGDLMQLMADCIGQPLSFIEDLDPDEGIKLISAFLEVNADFFIKKVLPELKDMMNKKQKIGQK
jgi:hypothetical protein